MGAVDFPGRWGHRCCCGTTLDFFFSWFSSSECSVSLELHAIWTGCSTQWEALLCTEGKTQKIYLHQDPVYFNLVMSQTTKCFERAFSSPDSTCTLKVRKWQPAINNNHDSKNYLKQVTEPIFLQLTAFFLRAGGSAAKAKKLSERSDRGRITTNRWMIMWQAKWFIFITAASSGSFNLYHRSAQKAVSTLCPTSAGWKEWSFSPHILVETMTVIGIRNKSPLYVLILLRVLFTLRMTKTNVITIIKWFNGYLFVQFHSKTQKR